MSTWKIVGLVVAVVVAINLFSYFWASRAAARELASGDGGPTGARS